MNKTMKLIKLSEEHYIVVDDSEIKDGDFVYSSDGGIFKRHIDNPCQTVFPISKVTHSTQPKSLGMGWMQSVQPLFLSEVEELIGKVDVEKSMWYERNLQNPYPSDSPSNTGFNKGFELGYNQALEDNKERKYTEEDILDAFTWGFMEGTERGDVTDSVNKFSQALQPKTEWEVEIVDGKLKLEQ